MYNMKPTNYGKENLKESLIVSNVIKCLQAKYIFISVVANDIGSRNTSG